jgi:hypothetical protein
MPNLQGDEGPEPKSFIAGAALMSIDEPGNRTSIERVSDETVLLKQKCIE